MSRLDWTGNLRGLCTIKKPFFGTQIWFPWFPPLLKGDWDESNDDSERSSCDDCERSDGDSRMSVDEERPANNFEGLQASEQV